MLSNTNKKYRDDPLWKRENGALPRFLETSSTRMYTAQPYARLLGPINPDPWVVTTAKLKAGRPRL
jgi:hypothetical protein